MVELSSKPNPSIFWPIVGNVAGRAPNNLVADPVKPVQKIQRLRGESWGDRRFREDLAVADQDREPAVNLLV
jgi:hypothetical protein